MIQKNQVITVILNQFQTFPAPTRFRHLNPRLLQQTPQHFSIYGIVIHYQYLCIRCAKLGIICIILRHLMNPGLQIPYWRMIHHLLFQLKIKFRTFPIDTFHLQPAAHQFQQLNGYAHSQPAALNIPVPLLLDPLKLRRKLRQIFLFYPNARILYFKFQHCRPFPCSAAPDTQPYRPFMSIFHRIGKNIRQYLTDTHIIPIQPGRNFMAGLHLQPDALLPCPLRSHACQIVNQAADVIFHRHYLHFPGLNLGKVQYIIDQQQQILAGRINIHGIFLYILLFRFPQNHFIHAQHGIDRRTDFMGHMCQEFPLCLIRGQSLHLRSFRLSLRLSQQQILPFRLHYLRLRTGAVFLRQLQYMHDSHHNGKNCHTVLPCRIAVYTVKKSIHNHICNSAGKQHNHGQYGQPSLITLVSVIELHQGHDSRQTDHPYHGGRDVYHIF